MTYLTYMPLSPKEQEMSRASRNKLEQATLAEVFNKEPQEPGMSSRLGRTLPVTVRLPKNAVTPGALERTRQGPASPDKQRNDDIDNELCA